MPTTDPAPQAFLQLAGHPLRWLLLLELSRSDRTVNELSVFADQRQNLVSYHLKKLRDARLVSSHRSSADGRDTYYSVDLTRFGELLAATGAALHPGLAPTSGSPAPRGRKRRFGPRVLFLCTGNSARSQMAEALITAGSAGHVHASSAGSHPKPVHPDAVRAMRRVHGIDLSAHRSKHFDLFAGERFDHVITLCDRVREVCPPFSGRPAVSHWSVPDPAAGAGNGGSAGYPAFEQTAAELDVRVRFLLARLAPVTPRPTDREEHQ